MNYKEQDSFLSYEKPVEAFAWGEFCLWPKVKLYKTSLSHPECFVKRRETRGIDRVLLSLETNQAGAIRQIRFEGRRKAVRFEE